MQNERKNEFEGSDDPKNYREMDYIDLLEKKEAAKKDAAPKRTIKVRVKAQGSKRV